MKFKLHDIRESKVWQEAHQEGIEKGETRKMKKIIDTLRAKRKTLKEISALLDIPVEELRQVTDNHFN